MYPESKKFDYQKNLIKRLLFAITLLLVLAGCSGSVSNSNNKGGGTTTPSISVEGLDELFNRKQRMAAATYPVSVLEDAANNYIWQPETVMYRDVTTGHEVWRMTNTPGLSNFYHNDIGVSPWSADGKRMAVASIRPTNAFTTSSRIWMIVDTDGHNFRPTANAANRLYGSVNGYFHWSPQIPDTYYEIGYGLNNPDELYKTTVTDTDVSTTLLATFPENIKLDKMISGDGRKLLVSAYDEATVYPTTIFPTVMVDDVDGYSIDRGLALYGTTPDAYSTVHDRYYAGDGAWYYVMPIGSPYRAWWRLKTSGSAADGGALCDNTDFPVTDTTYNFAECWPENDGYGLIYANSAANPFSATTSAYDPGRTVYWSHFVPDRWGRYALFSNTADSLPGAGGYFDRVGSGTWDVQNHQYAVATFGGGAQHHDWHGFTDYVVSSRGSGGDPDYLNDRVYAAKYNDVNSRITVAYTHTHYNGGGPSTYPSGTRPGQSPDGTKVAWHSEFLNSGADNPDVFWAVVYYPYPPTDVSAVNNNGVKIEWLPPKYTERGWPYASSNPAKDTLGWPSLDSNSNEIGEPLYAREIKRYHVWRASNQNGPWQAVGSVDAQYSYTYVEDPNMFMLHPVVGSFKVEASNKISFTDTPGDGSFYYALTSEEHSGLASDELSEILQVTVSGGNISSQSIVQAKGQKNFWTSPPAVASGFSVTTVDAAAGHYRLTWTEPGDDKIRFYNVYYSTSSNPPIDPTTRIASLAVGTSTYLDWLADANASNHYYAITAVDRQGNESNPVYVGGG